VDTGAGALETGQASVNYPKIELHVHLEGTVRAGTLLEIAARNGIALPADSAEGLAGLYEFRDFAHFIEIWKLTTGALRTEQDFRQVVADYAAEAAAHGAVYLEGIFSPAEPASRRVSWDEVFTGYCDGAQQAREHHGVEVRLTPDIPRGFPLEAAELTARYAVKYRDRGVVGLGPEAIYQAGLHGALCDEVTRAALRRAGEACDWAAAAAAAQP